MTNNITTTTISAANSSTDVTTTTTISFSSTTLTPPSTTHLLVKEEIEENIKICNNSPDCRKIKNTSPENQDRCPDLNLELSIGPPYHQDQKDSVSSSHVQQHHHALMTGGINSGGGTICFTCSLGVQNSKECSCTSGLNGSTGNSTGFDFLSFKNGALDYRSLEMK